MKHIGQKRIRELPEINATRKVNFQVALIPKDYPKKTLPAYCQLPKNNATREIAFQVTFQMPPFPTIYSLSHIMYPPSPYHIMSSIISKDISNVDFVILKSFHIPFCFLAKCLTLYIHTCRDNTKQPSTEYAEVKTVWCRYVF